MRLGGAGLVLGYALAARASWCHHLVFTHLLDPAGAEGGALDQRLDHGSLAGGLRAGAVADAISSFPPFHGSNPSCTDVVQEFGCAAPRSGAARLRRLTVMARSLPP